MIQPGDKCWVQGAKKHYGVCTGYGSDGEPWFVHNMPGSGVIETTRVGFAGNKAIHVEQSATPGYESVIVARARALIGRNYSLLGFNCEHAANWAAHGQAESKQVQRGFVATVFGALVIAALNENGTSVDDSGYRRDGDGRFASRRWW